MTLVCCALGRFYMYHQVDHTCYEDSASKDALCLFTSALLLTFWNGFILQCCHSQPHRTEDLAVKGYYNFARVVTHLLVNL